MSKESDTIAAAGRRIAFQGEPGAFSEEAALLLDPRARTVPCRTFEDLFAAIGDGRADRALVPIENSLAGSVLRCFDLLLETPLQIVGEVVLHVSHQLIGIRGAALAEVRTVESHPVALAQCEKFFAAHPQIQRKVAEDTAGSARAIAESGDRTRAAIASKRAAELYGGEILAGDIQDDTENYTRFLLLADEAQMQAAGISEDGNKLSLAVELEHRPGSLLAALTPFAEAGIDLVKIESRPVKGRPWEYRFFLDLAGSMADERVQNALKELEGLTRSVRVLGCYPAWDGARKAAPK